VTFNSYYGQWRALGFDELTDFRAVFEPPRGNVTLMLALLPATFILDPLRARFSPALSLLRLMPPVLLSTALLVTFSRGVYMGLATFSLAAGALAIQCGVAPGKSVRRCLTWVGVPVLAILVLTSWFRFSLTTMGAVHTTSHVRSTAAHLENWKISWLIIREHAIFGVGGYNSALMMIRYRPQGDGSVQSVVFNWILQEWQEEGLLGLSCYGLLLGASFYSAYWSARNSRNTLFRRRVCVLWMAGMLAVLVRDLSYSSITLDAGAMMAVWAGFAIANGPSASRKDSVCDQPAELILR
jgi:hypothetical protein